MTLSSTGLLSGTPNSVTITGFQLTATVTGSTPVTKLFTLHIQNEIPQQLSIDLSTTDFHTVAVNQPVQLAVSATSAEGHSPGRSTAARRYRQV